MPDSSIRWPSTQILIVQILLVPLCLILSACSSESSIDLYQPHYSDQPPTRTSQLLFGVHPLHNPKRLFEVYQPLVNYLNRQLGQVKIKLEASRNYATYDEKLFSGHFDLALPNPYQTVIADDRGYNVFGKMGGDDDFRGILLVRRDASIHSVDDLRGRVVSYPAPTALAATMLPQWFLHTNGLDVMRDIDNVYVGSQESSIMNVYLGKSAAGATWPPPWRAFARERPEVADELVVRWQTDPLPNNGLVARDDLARELVTSIGELLFNLHKNAEGREILSAMELAYFESADAATYQPVRDFLSRFEAEVRPVREGNQ